MKKNLHCETDKEIDGADPRVAVKQAIQVIWSKVKLGGSGEKCEYLYADSAGQLSSDSWPHFNKAADGRPIATICLVPCKTNAGKPAV